MLESNNLNSNLKNDDDDVAIYCQLSVPCVDKDDNDDCVDIIAQFESRKHYDMVEGDMFDTMGPLINIYFATSSLFADKAIWVDGIIESVKFLEKEPSNANYMIVKRRKLH